jgi:hypothetical protein
MWTAGRVNLWTVSVVRGELHVVAKRSTVIHSYPHSHPQLWVDLYPDSTPSCPQHEPPLGVTSEATSTPLCGTDLLPPTPEMRWHTGKT